MVLEKNFLSFIKTYKEDWNSVMFEISKNNVSYQGKKHGNHYRSSTTSTL